MFDTPTIEEEDYKGHVIEIEIDPDPINPRSWDNVTTVKSDDSRIPSEEQQGSNILMSKPLYIYEHSQISISTTPFQSRWDSNRAGSVIITEERAERIGINTDEETLEEAIEAEVETYDKYIRGDVYSFILRDGSGEVIDSCGGFYDTYYAMKEAKGIVDHRVRKARDKRHEKLQAMIKNNVPLDKRQEELDKIEVGC